MSKMNVGILIFDDVEVLDFAGPFEVFSRTRTIPGGVSRRSDEHAPFNGFTVAKTATAVATTGGLQVIPHYGFADAPEIDLVLVPGGFGTRALIDDQATLDWIRETSATAQLTTSVCTGSLLLAKAGLLEGKRATTHFGRAGFARGSQRRGYRRAHIALGRRRHRHLGGGRRRHRHGVSRRRTAMRPGGRRRDRALH